jgi:pyruvate/2-oxoglutarate dehydrogenase complex dihydrolipoamide dehydrogenase (E3) component
VDGETRGLVKITADKKGRVMAASILGSHAGDLLQPLVLAKRTGLTLNDIADTIFPYPTMAEGVLRAANAFRRTRLDSAGGRVLTKVISWLK